MADDCEPGGLSPIFVFWWIVAFVTLILILIIATVIANFVGRDDRCPCP